LWYLPSQFEIFLTTISLPPAEVTTMALAASALHNLLTEKRAYLYTQWEIILLKKTLLSVLKCDAMK
jgi:hypothetical protein